MNEPPWEGPPPAGPSGTPGPTPLEPGQPLRPEQLNAGYFEPWALLQEEMRKRERFFGALQGRSWVTLAIIAVNLAAYALVTWVFREDLGGFFGGLFSGLDREDLIAAGAKYNPLITRGEVWRLVSCAFLHIGIIHLVANMWSLWNLGRLLENIWGRMGFLAIYLGSGLAGSLASFWFPRSASVPAAGASGAIYGLVGAGIVLSIKYRRALPHQVAKAIFGNLAVWGGLFLALGFVFPFIDNAAHLGGLAGGMFLSLAIPAAIFPREQGVLTAARAWVPAAVFTTASVLGLAVGAQYVAHMDLDSRLANLELTEYRSQVYGFAVSTPPHWEAQVEEAGGVFFYDGLNRPLQVLVRPRLPYDSLDADLDRGAYLLGKAEGIADLLELERTYFTRTGLDFARVHLRYSYEGTATDQVRYVALTQDKIYLLVFLMQADRSYPVGRADKIFETFRILP